MLEEQANPQEELLDAEVSLKEALALLKVTILGVLIREWLETPAGAEEEQIEELRSISQSKPIFDLCADVVRRLSEKLITLEAVPTSKEKEELVSTVKLLEKRGRLVIEASARLDRAKEALGHHWAHVDHPISSTRPSTPHDPTSSGTGSTAASHPFGNSVTQKQHKKSDKESSANEAESVQVGELGLPKEVIKLMKQSLDKLERLLKQSSPEDVWHPDANLDTQPTDDLLNSDTESARSDDSKAAKAKYDELGLNQFGPDRVQSSRQDNASATEEIETQETQAERIRALVSREDGSLQFPHDLPNLPDASYKPVGDIADLVGYAVLSYL